MLTLLALLLKYNVIVIGAIYLLVLLYDLKQEFFPSKKRFYEVGPLLHEAAIRKYRRRYNKVANDSLWKI